MVTELARGWREKPQALVHATLVSQHVWTDFPAVMYELGCCCEKSSHSEVSCVSLLLRIIPTLSMTSLTFNAPQVSEVNACCNCPS